MKLEQGVYTYLHDVFQPVFWCWVTWHKSQMHITF